MQCIADNGKQIVHRFGVVLVVCCQPVVTKQPLQGTKEAP